MVSQIDNQLKQIKEKQSSILNEIEQNINDLKSNYNIHLNIQALKKENEAMVQNYLGLRYSKKNISFIEEIMQRVNELPVSNGTSYFKKFDINIGVIANTSIYNNLKDAVNLYHIDINNYRELEDQIEILIVTNTWSDIFNKNDEFNHLTSYAREINNIIQFFKARGVKIAYYEVETYKRNIGTLNDDLIKQCEYIFTAYPHKISNYMNQFQNNNVFSINFGFNPLMYNPIGLKRTSKYKDVLFIDPWIDENSQEISMLFNGVFYSGKGIKVLDSFDFKSHSKELRNQNVFKFFDWVLKIADTGTFDKFYKLQASGVNILSGYNSELNNQFPNVYLIHDEEEIDYIVNLPTIEKYMHQMVGVRKVFKESTIFHGFSNLLELMGYSDFDVPDRSVVIVAKEKNDLILQSFNRQAYKNKQIFTLDEVNENKDVLNKYDYVAFFSPKYFYGEYYLEDLINGFKYTDSSYITKDSYIDRGSKVNGIEHDYVSVMKDKYRTVFDIQKYDINEVLAIQENNIALSNGYSVDYLEIDTMTTPIISQPKTRDYKFSIIIPVFNNGEYLYSKCIMSLRRSSMFNEMEIIIVDDGSTDVDTLLMIDRLERMYSNIKTYKFGDGGSGSASRPRNKGIELSTTNYITYLDPDNEAVSDGYTFLYNKLMEDESLDIVIGDNIAARKTSSVHKFSIRGFKWDSSGIITDPKEFLIGTGLGSQSIQAFMVKKDIIVKNNLEMVEKAAGQDTLFFQQLLLNCRKIKITDKVIHVYYAAVTQSVTNSISKAFYNKYLILEKERIKFLLENNILDSYIEKRLVHYFKTWYFVRVPRLKNEDIVAGLDVLYEIFLLYRPYIKEIKDQWMEIFEKLLSEKKHMEFYSFCKENVREN